MTMKFVGWVKNVVVVGLLAGWAIVIVIIIAGLFYGSPLKYILAASFIYGIYTWLLIILSGVLILATAWISRRAYNYIKNHEKK